MALLLLVLSCIGLINAINSRERYRMNFNWSFHLGSRDLQHVTCTASQFTKTSDKYCGGFIELPDINKDNANECANACCANPTCAYFQISSSGICSIGNLISIYQAFNWASTCKSQNGNSFYSRSGTPDINVSHFAPVAKDFDDSEWIIVNLPHDFIVNGTVTSAQTDESHGYLPKNVSWYRKHFSLPLEYQNDTTLWIDFDGIYRNSIVFINGVFKGNHSSGYTSFRYYLDPVTDKLEFGDNSNNVITVWVDATAEEGWWYEGGGIYRNVWFNAANKIHFEPKGGIYLPTSVSQVNYDGMTGTGDLIINTTINNDYDKNINNMDPEINVKFDIINPDGTVLHSLEKSYVTINPLSSKTVSTSYTHKDIQLWSAENPVLYILNATIMDARHNDEIIDNVQVRYGYRKVVFDVDKGLFLNDKSVKLKGFCNHQDFGGTGVKSSFYFLLATALHIFLQIATPERINRYRIEHLKRMGANSWRMSHNPPNPELLSFADEYGFLIWDENRHFGDSPQWKQDQADMIIRDRNHPSIIMWSICNEGGCHENGDPELANLTIAFKDIIHKYDGIYNGDNQWGYNRPITAAMNADWGDAMSPLLDIQGFNYNYNLDQYHQENPKQSIIESESCSCVTDRNEYKTDATTGHVDAYGYCPWNKIPCPDGCWTPIAETDYIIGSFDWTGFDYKGEPTPDSWPTINSVE